MPDRPARVVASSFPVPAMPRLSRDEHGLGGVLVHADGRVRCVHRSRAPEDRPPLGAPLAARGAA